MRTIRDIEAIVDFNFAAYEGAPNFNFSVSLNDAGQVAVELIDGDNSIVEINPLEPNISRSGVDMRVDQSVDIVIAR